MTMHILFDNDATRYATKHPASVIAGDVFVDVDGEGAPTHILTLRGAVRLRSSANYRIIGVNVNTGKIAAHRFGEDRNIEILGFVNDITLEPGAMLAAGGIDPAINERDAALEALRDEPFTGDDVLSGGPSDDDADPLTEPE